MSELQSWRCPCGDIKRAAFRAKPVIVAAVGTILLLMQTEVEHRGRSTNDVSKEHI